MTLENVHKATSTYISTVAHNATTDFLRALYRAMLETTEVVDKTTSWAMALTGAALALIISNMAAIATIMPITSLQWLLAFLLLSAIAGAFGKMAAARVEIYRRIDVTLWASCQPIFDELSKTEERVQEDLNRVGSPMQVNIDIDLARVAAEISSTVPYLFKRRLSSTMERSLEDPLLSFRTATLYLHRQCYLSLLQLILIGAGIVVVIGSMAI